MTVEVESAREERTGDGTRQRLLVVDDSDFFRQLLEETLTAAGFEVTTSPDAEEALATLGRGLPDLLVVDLVMPGMDGFELVRRVRERWSAGELPLIVVTEILASDVALARLEALGCNGFVNKFAPPDHIVFRIRQAMFPCDREQRHEGRLAVALAVQYSTSDGSSLGYTNSLSTSGMFIRRSDPPSVGQSVEVSFSLPGTEETIRARGEVVRRREHSRGPRSPVGFAVRFDDLEAEVEKSLEEFVQRALRSGM